MTFKKLQETLRGFKKGDILPTLNASTKRKLWIEVKKVWLAALEGGGYKQGQSQMRLSKTEFCCLGVLADVLVPDAWEEAEGGESCYQSAWSHPLTDGGILDAAVWALFAPQELHQRYLTFTNDSNHGFVPSACVIRAGLCRCYDATGRSHDI